MSKKLYLFLIGVLLSSVSLGQDTETIIVKQPNSPIKIQSYEASFEAGGTYTTEGVHHEIDYKNLSGLNSVAIEFGFVSFNIFNEYLGSTHGIDMSNLEMTKTDNGTWVQTSLSDFSFYTGVTYVSKVRFDNDDIWEANLELVTDTLQAIESDFDSSVLKED